MGYLDVIVWSAIAVIFFIVEIATVATISIWFVGGAIVAVAVALLGGPLWLQFALFVGVSFGLLFGLRKKLAASKASKEIDAKITDGMEGKTAVVTSTIEPGEKGQIRYDGIEWTAMAIDDEMQLNEKSKVIICRVEGSTCFVDKYELN